MSKAGSHQPSAEISAEGRTFIYLNDRPRGGKVYASRDRREYLRTAKAVEIAREANLTKDLYRRGFPVPEVLAIGTLEDGTAYYLERSIGERTFGEIFTEETEAQGRAGEASFDAFLQIMNRYCRAQFHPRNRVPHDRDALAELVALANVTRNNPPSPDMRAPFGEAYERASERVMSLPWGYVQADLAAFNILPAGVIDFEFAGIGPVGYDVVTNVHFGRMWPQADVAFVFTDEQVARYTAAIDEVALDNDLPAPSSFADDFLVLKAIWSSGKDAESEDDPDSESGFWAWRVRMRDWCIRQYLAGETIDSNRFEAIATDPR